MTIAEGRSPAGLIARVQNVLTRPSPEWDVIAGEPATVGGLFTGYACILAAIGPIAELIGALLWHRESATAAVIGAVALYVFSLLGVYVIALIVDVMAPSFGGQRSQIQALKLVVYSSTARWVAGVFNIVPVLGALIGLIGGIYSLYLLYLGLPKLMGNPPDKTPIYLVAIIVAAIIVYVVVAVVVGLLVAMLAVGSAAAIAVH